MNVSEMQKLPGMPSGFPFAMILLGIASQLVVAFIGSIGGGFFSVLSTVLSTLGGELIKWGSILQAIHWICSAFARKVAGPPAP